MLGELLGRGLVKAVRQIDPDITCIFLSGYRSAFGERLTLLNERQVL